MGLTDSKGYVVIKGKPGTWKLTFSRKGSSLLAQFTMSRQLVRLPHIFNRISRCQEQVALTIYVREGNPTGPQLSGVRVAGQDATGNSFSQLTYLDRSVVISGQPGTWQFTFSKVVYLLLS